MIIRPNHRKSTVCPLPAAFSAAVPGASRAVLQFGWLLAVVVLVLANASDTRAQAVFGPPPPPQAASSAVRGLYDPAQGPSQGPAQVVPRTPAAPSVAPPITAITAITGSAANLGKAKLIEGGEIIARINGQVVLASDVLWQVNKLIDANRDRIPPAEVPNVRKMLLRQQVLKLLDTKLLYAEFRNTVPAEKFPDIEANLLEPFEKNEIPRLLKIFEVEDRQTLAEKLRADGTSLADVRRQFNEQTIAGEWLRQLTPEPKSITHEDLLNHYQENVEQYKFSAKVRWEELVIQPGRLGGNRAAAWREISLLGNQIWTQVSNNPGIRGPVFAKLAKEKSHGLTAQQGGRHDWTTQGALRSEAVDKALFSLEIGQMSNVLESPLGFHIVRVLERTDAGQTPFTEAQVEIRKKIQQQRTRSLGQAQLEELRKNSRVWTVFDGHLSAKQIDEATRPTKRR